jgi:hypothetical protein
MDNLNTASQLLSNATSRLPTYTQEPYESENNSPHNSQLKYNSLKLKSRMNSDHFLKVEFEYTETKETSAKQERDGTEVQNRFLVHNP